MKISNFKIGQKVTYNNGSIYSGTIKAITHQLIIVDETNAAELELWNAGYAVGACISPSQVIRVLDI